MYNNYKNEPIPGLVPVEAPKPRPSTQPTPTVTKSITIVKQSSTDSRKLLTKARPMERRVAPENSIRRRKPPKGGTIISSVKLSMSRLRMLFCSLIFITLLASLCGIASVTGIVLYMLHVI